MFLIPSFYQPLSETLHATVQQQFNHSKSTVDFYKGYLFTECL